MEKEIQISNNKIKRYLWMVAGFLCVGLGIAGYILPVMPGTTFIIIALYCFARSNEKWYNWILNNKYFGQTIRDYKEGKGMSFKAKTSALICIVGSISISLYFASNIWVSLFLLACGSFAIYMVCKQKLKNE